MMIRGNIEVQLMWQLLFPGVPGKLSEPPVDYGDLLDGMEAAELMSLMTKVQERLKNLGCGLESLPEPVELFIDKNYSIRMGGPDGPILQLRPLVKTLFILFLRHPEGILLKRRDSFRAELEEIYSTINPNRRSCFQRGSWTIIRFKDAMDAHERSGLIRCWFTGVEAK